MVSRKIVEPVPLSYMKLTSSGDSKHDNSFLTSTQTVAANYTLIFIKDTKFK